MTKVKEKLVRRPRIRITTTDLGILESMVGGGGSPTAAITLLEEELTRAVIVNDRAGTQSFCRIGSWVTYEDLGTGQVRNIQIVLPRDADIDKRQVSVLSLVGASLLGLTTDAEFGWSDDHGRPHRLRVLHVGDQPDARHE